MKQTTALVLLLAVCISLFALRQDRYPQIDDLLDAGDYQGAMLSVYELYQANSPTDTEPTADPALVWKYQTLSNAISSLTHYVSNDYDLSSFCFSHFDGSAHTVYQGMEAVQWLYDTALELGDYEDAASIASRFTVLENTALQKVYSYTDALGNQTEASRIHYVYSTDGSLLSQSNDRFLDSDYFSLNYGTPVRTLDETGKVLELRYVSGDTVNCVIDYTYNEDGTLAATHYLDRDGFEYHITHTYEDGLLVQSAGLPYAEYSADTMTVTYLYDENGLLLREEGVKDTPERSQVNRCVKIVEYTYDAQGRVTAIRRASEYHEKESYEDTDYVLRHYEDVRLWTREYDRVGNLVRNTYALIGSTDLEGNPQNPSYRTYVGETTYGTYYVYTPEQ